MKLSVLGLVLVSVLFGCVEAREPEPGVQRATLRELVEAGPVMEVRAAPAAGAVTASRRDGGEWIEGIVEFGVESGTVVIAGDAAGGVVVEELALEIAPIALPEDLVGQHAEFTQVRVALRAPAAATTVWLGRDAARVTAMVEMDLTWVLAIGGATIPIFAPDLPPLPLVMDLDGDGHVIDAEVKLVAGGELWSWAGLVRLDGLRLAVEATTGE